MALVVRREDALAPGREARLRLGESDTDCMRFPALSLSDAIGRFTEAVYGRRMDFEHA